MQTSPIAPLQNKQVESYAIAKGQDEWWSAFCETNANKTEHFVEVFSVTVQSVSTCSFLLLIRAMVTKAEMKQVTVNMVLRANTKKQTIGTLKIAYLTIY